VAFFSRDEPLEESFFGDDLVLKIPASFESSRNQRYQEFAGEFKDDSATYHNLLIKKTVNFNNTIYAVC
jgi:hypothetical protein